MTILRENKTPEHVIRHCAAVADVAARVGEELNRTGLSLDVGLISFAAMLHDVARSESEHAAAGAKLLRDMGFERAACIVEAHMEHHFPESTDDFTELDVVCVGDRTVKEDRYVGFDRRMEDVLARYADKPEIIAGLKSRMERSRLMIKKVEERIGGPIGGLLGLPPVSMEACLLQVEKPGRYVGGEMNSVHKEAASQELRFGLAFPDMYEIGMSWIGLQILYHLLNGMDGVYCERIFAPAEDFENIMRKHGAPLMTLETKTRVDSLDMLGFTLQYELSYTNIVNMLKFAGIPARSAERGPEAGAYPILIAGGPCSFNPEPLADMFDLFLIGDGEEALPELCEMYMSHKRAAGTGNVDKDAFLKAASTINGIYVPSFYAPIYSESGVFSGMDKVYDAAPDRIVKRVVKDLNKAFVPEKPIVPLIEVVQDRVNVEIFRGCVRGCRFCQAGMIYRPMRERDQTLIYEKAMAQLSSTGYDEMSLLSLSTSDYSGVEALAAKLARDCGDRNVAISIPSLRVDSFSLKMLEDIQGYKKTGLTFAPEAGTQRMRDVINKNITEDDILSAVREAAGLGWNHVKFYFMIGLPTETVDDVEGIADIARKAMREAKTAKGGVKGGFALTVSVSNFVPKPHTPFQWVAQESQESLYKKVLLLKESLSKAKGVKFQYHDTKASHVEALLARGDRRVLAAIEKASELGCGFDSWQERFDYDKWREAFEAAGVSFESEGFGPDRALPWEHISCGVSARYLAAEWEKALRGTTTKDCRGGCVGCGLDDCGMAKRTEK
ncbi:MAG: TIGR03960 family B12-binding radical SAM protein [Clostridiales Family XIII bacterium]|nr:TIGR03960 family B12-binding radical SAM protein [Clostridiales Family XIII bacterium]